MTCSAVYGAVYHSSDFATYLLGIFILNLMIYCTFYIIMKVCILYHFQSYAFISYDVQYTHQNVHYYISSQLRYGEKIHSLVMFIILGTVVVWAVALYFFFSNLTSWQVKVLFSYNSHVCTCILFFF